MPASADDPKNTFHTPKEVANRLKVSVKTIYDVIAAGLLPCVRIGRGRGTIRIRESDLQDYLRASQVTSPQSSVRTALQRIDEMLDLAKRERQSGKEKSGGRS